ncbi:molybdopterin molybdotransferase MoeA [Flavobacterium soyangense]|uniref:Molybdopterin molybdenumtransferase n=1 Tax=Flavobacterium soyangense TaxID=2023265 RepID=A0A930XX27_9FLAO|nr:gephyrin-like molybdotransferase Glp [Flavobacterium soyangense]MBF2709802.1 molybdopterin molybdotransferase MoeA [Flavobacterium soyangense]
MIQVNDAISIIKDNCFKMAAKKIRVSKSLGYILAESIFSPINMPPFRQSSMDGYAFSYGESRRFDIIGTSQAGDFLNFEIKKNQAVRIFTGAFVPDNADTVVMQENITATEGVIEINKMPLRFDNVRKKGEQVKKGELVLKENTLITPAAIGFLVSLGIKEIMIHDKPKVAIVVTGNELVKAGKKLPKGKIYESNSIMLKVALQQTGVKKVKTFRVKDNFEATKTVLKDCLSDFDIVLVSGGISVGDFDFVKESLLSNNVEELFYKINQKPGKPLFFGKKENTIVFALPGNPASALTCFYVYVLPAIKKMLGYEAIHLPKINRKISTDFTNSTGKALFLKAFYDDEKVTVLDSQSSAMLNTFAVANGLIYLPYDLVNIKQEMEVTVLPFN